MIKSNGPNPYNVRLHQEAQGRDRELLALAEGMPVAQLAQRLHVSRSWLYYRLRRAKLAEALKTA